MSLDDVVSHNDIRSTSKILFSDMFDNHLIVDAQLKSSLRRIASHTSSFMVLLVRERHQLF